MYSMYSICVCNILLTQDLLSHQQEAVPEIQKLEATCEN